MAESDYHKATMKSASSVLAGQTICLAGKLQSTHGVVSTLFSSHGAYVTTSPGPGTIMVAPDSGFDLSCAKANKAKLYFLKKCIIQ